MKRILQAGLVVAVGMAFYLLGRYQSPSKPVATATTRHILYYEDPMHPQYRSDKPGTAPDCGMELVPVYSDSIKASFAAAMPGTVTIDAERQQLYGIRVAKAVKTSGSRNVRLLGNVSVDETRVYRVVAGAEGWVRETYGDSVGTQVSKNQKLAIYYSPEFVALQTGYLSATKRTTSAVEESVRGTQNFADRLRNLGMTDDQIKRLGDSKRIPDNIEISSPVDGFIISRNIAPGLRFDRGIELYRVADLSHVWVLADIFEDEAQYFHPGAVARITIPNSGKMLTAKVSDVLPQVDPTTRTLKLRLEVDNPGFALRPDMFVDVELSVPAPRGLSVPVDAVLDAGDRKRVFVDLGDGHFETREVVTAERYGDRVQIVKGLKEGESVVVSGTFLVDSESRLKSVANAGPPPERVNSESHMSAKDMGGGQ